MIQARVECDGGGGAKPGQEGPSIECDHVQFSRARGSRQQDCGNRERIPAEAHDGCGVKCYCVEQKMDFTNERVAYLKNLRV